MNLATIVDPHPDRAPALVSGSGEVMTYGQIRSAVTKLQSRLDAAGVVPDDRVAILSANDPAFVVAYLAILRAGAVAVPLNVVSPPAELNRQLAQVDVAAILIGPGADVESLAAVTVLPIDSGRSRRSGEDPGPQPASGENAGPQRASNENPAPEGRSGEVPGPQWASGEDTGPEEARSDDSIPALVARAGDDLAALLFTAGTAGAPRAAILTHGNLLSNLDQVQRHPGRAIEAADRLLGVLPLCHIFGLNAVLGGALYAGASVVLMERFDAGRTLEVIADQGITILVGAPTLFAALTAAPSKVANPMASVRIAFSGAAPLSMEVAEAWLARFGLPLRQGYGLTEAAPVVTTAVMDEPARPGSIGVPVPGVELLLVDDDGEPALAGDPGEIWVRGPNVFPGYWRDAAATEAALTPDGWLRTGDIAVVGDDGDLAIVDRAKDLIIVSGFNVFPAEVEEVLGEHPGVADVAVVGDLDRFRGEVVHAFVVLASRGQPPSTTSLKDWCAVRLARYKCPTEVTIVESLPHGLGGKLLRRSLRSTAQPAQPASAATAPQPAPAAER